MKAFIKKYGYLHFLLMPFFFVLHGWSENFQYIDIADIFVLIGLYLLAALSIFGISYFLYKNIWKSALLSFLIVGLNLFFTFYRDIITNVVPRLGLSENFKYWIIILGIIIIINIIFLKISNKEGKALSQFLTIIFAIFIVMDTFSLFAKIGSKKEDGFVKNGTSFVIDCDTCKHPDIYLILADEYTSSISLKDIWEQDNTAFDNALQQRGFHIINNSKSNYDITFFSMATTLNMQYPTFVGNYKEKEKEWYMQCLSLIKNNALTHSLIQSGYQFKNLSPFDIMNQPSIVNDNFLPVKSRLIADNTFINCIKKETGVSLWDKLTGGGDAAYYVYRNNNEKILNSFNETIADSNSSQPKFVYTHLFMPHNPFYYDSMGNETTLEDLKKERTLKNNHAAYFSYIKYSNKVFLQLIDAIQKSTNNNAVILFLSDHAYRRKNEANGKIDKFSNQNAIFIPNGDYSNFPENTTNINMFIKLMNTLFNTKLADQADKQIELFNVEE